MSHTLSQILRSNQIPEETVKAILDEYAHCLNIPTHKVDDFFSRSQQYEVSSSDTNTILEEVPYIRRGDVVHKKGGSSYRNDDKKIWNGKEAIDLYDRIDDYGGLPPEFTLNEFPNTHYFDETIAHNSQRWIRFTLDDIISFCDDYCFGVHIRDPDGLGCTYTLRIPEDMEGFKTIKEIYEKLNFEDGPLAIEYDGDEYPGTFKIWNERF